jgi:hypothetical protein
VDGDFGAFCEGGGELTASNFLRTASVLSIFNCAGHTTGVFSAPKHGAAEIAVVETMKSYQLDVMGSMRSYWDFLFGYGLSVTITLLVQAILFWQLAALAKRNPACVRPIAALFFFNCTGIAIISWKYFFIGPAVSQLLIATCLGVAFVRAGTPVTLSDEAAQLN